jgi:hypothetical protein
MCPRYEGNPTDLLLPGQGQLTSSERQPRIAERVEKGRNNDHGVRGFQALSPVSAFAAPQSLPQACREVTSQANHPALRGEQAQNRIAHAAGGHRQRRGEGPVNGR